MRPRGRQSGALNAARHVDSRILKVPLALVLALVGGKMLGHAWLKSPLGPSFNLYLLLVELGPSPSARHRPLPADEL